MLLTKRTLTTNTLSGVASRFLVTLIFLLPTGARAARRNTVSGSRRCEEMMKPVPYAAVPVVNYVRDLGRRLQHCYLGVKHSR